MNLLMFTFCRSVDEENDPCFGGWIGEVFVSG